MPEPVTVDRLERENAELRRRLAEAEATLLARGPARPGASRGDEAFYELIRNSPFGIYLVDADLRIREVSAGAQKVFENVRPLLGRPLAEALGMLWPEPFASEAVAHFRRTLETGEPHASPGTVERRQDVPRVEAYDWRVERIVLPDGSHGAVCHFYDLSERLRYEEALRESESFYRQTLESIPGMTFTNTPDGACDYVSEQWVNFTGVPAAEQLGDGWVQVLHPDDGPRAFAAWRAAVEGRGEYDLEYRVRRRDGAYRWFKVRGRAIRDKGGRIIRWFGVGISVQNLKEAEEALREADRRKDEFLAMLAHELRNPLAPIRNAVHLLRRRGAHDASVDGARDMIERQVSHLVRLVDDLLDVSRVSSGKIELRRGPLDLASVVLQAVETARPLVDARRHRLTVTLPREPVRVEGDFTRLAQVTGNLLHNAAKYTDEGGHIELRVERSEERVSEAVIRVKDSGRGIDPRAIDSLFDLFFQVDRNLDRAEGGLGIGLSLVKSLVEMHGGRVEAHSAGRGRGTEFIFRLPCLSGERPSSRPGSLPAAAPGARGRRVLVVDDNRDSADSMAMLLELDGHEVLVAHDGRAAVDIALRERPEVVLLDIGLPNLDGYQACRAMREGGLTGALLAAMTGYGQDEDRRRSREAGFDAHLVKPVDLVALRDLLARLAPGSPPP